MSEVDKSIEEIQQKNNRGKTKPIGLKFYLRRKKINYQEL